LALLPLADDEADRLLGRIPAESRNDCWWLVLGDGTPVPGNDGGPIAVLTEVRSTRPFGCLLRALHAGALLDATDRLVSRHLGRLGRLVPDGPAPRRYP
jgi:hypothetical protein